LRVSIVFILQQIPQRSTIPKICRLEAIHGGSNKKEMKLKDSRIINIFISNVGKVHPIIIQINDKHKCH